MFTQSLHAQYFDKDNSKQISRGTVEWQEDQVDITDCYLVSEKELPDTYEMSFSVKSQKNDQVQAWAGFGFKDRDNRYAIGLRGGNNQDLYLCKYQSEAENKILAIESLDFKLKSDQWYKLKLVFWQGEIRVYLNNETQARIVTKDSQYLDKGSAYLGSSWLKTTFKDISIKALSTVDINRYKADSIKYNTDLSLKEKETLRIKQRQQYTSCKLKKLNAHRTEFSLDGDWLFLPDYEDLPSKKAYALNANDSQWHVMQVPAFWNPVRNWLHLQDSHLPHAGSGISDNYREQEYRRCKGYTFDFEKTKYAWYKKTIVLPKHTATKHWSLHFDAVSKIADVYVNGQFVGQHIGMFGDFSYDVSKLLKEGENTIVVKVLARKEDKSDDADQKVTQAVSVEVTKDMLNSLPSGMFRGDEGGIWQSVKLVATATAYLEDVYAQTAMDGALIEVEINNTELKKGQFEVGFEIIDLENNKVFYSVDKSQNQFEQNSGQIKSIKYQTALLMPKLWSPEHPNLYQLITSLYKDGQLIDQVTTRIGFRSVEKKGNQFYLNGKPYWLRGANHPPCGIAPNNSKLANTFFKYMHDGNEMVTRSHGCPFTKAWMDAADTQGVGISYEGSWPWLLIGDIPEQELLNIWKAEMIALVKKYRNHPSLFIWTINNEMYFTMFYHNDPQEVRLRKWQFISDLIKEIRALSPNTLISADSGYSRVEKDYNKNLKPFGIDDGDIDDRHVYFNWYNRDFYQIYNGEWAKRIYWSPGANPDRIFFSQETSTGYTNNDDGHFNRKYLFNNYVPQAWLGDWAYENKDPRLTLNRHAFMTKELYEAIRRTSPETAGVLLFANVCWFKNVYDAENIEPYPVYKSVQKAAQPVLISAELFGRNFYAGDKINPRLCIVNNDVNGKNLDESTVEWKIVYDDEILSSGAENMPAVKHYDRQWQNCNIQLPSSLPVAKANCKLVLSLKQGDQQVSYNEYDLLISEKTWLDTKMINQHKSIAVFDLTGATTTALDFLGIKYQNMKDLTELRLLDADLFIIANLDVDNEIPFNWEDVKKISRNGTNVLLIHPGKHLKWLYYNKVESIYERKGRIVNMHIPEHPVFNDIEALELAWWQQEDRETPRACRRSYRLAHMDNSLALGTYLRPHTDLGSNKKAYLQEMSGIPLLEISEDKGHLIASEMEVNRAIKDPIAAKLLVNMIAYLLE
jgi:hypothetical protein